MNQLPLIRERKAEKDAVFRCLRCRKPTTTRTGGKAALKEKTGLELGMNSNTLFQGLSTALPGEDQWAVATTLDFVGTWEAINRGKPNQGQVFFK